MHVVGRRIDSLDSHYVLAWTTHRSTDEAAALPQRQQPGAFPDQAARFLAA